MPLSGKTDRGEIIEIKGKEWNIERLNSYMAKTSPALLNTSQTDKTLSQSQMLSGKVEEAWAEYFRVNNNLPRVYDGGFIREG